MVTTFLKLLYERGSPDPNINNTIMAIRKSVQSANTKTVDSVNTTKVKRETDEARQRTRTLAKQQQAQGAEGPMPQVLTTI